MTLNFNKEHIFVLLILFAGVARVDAATYNVDPGSSNIAFRIKHTVGFNSGFIKNFSGTLDVSKKYKLTSLTLDADMTSITTFNQDRDPIVHSEDFFNTAQYPKGQIKSRKIEDGFMTATVNIKGIKQEVLFYYQFLGLSKSGDGNESAVVTLQGSLKKKDFDLDYSSLTLEGNENIGKSVDLLIKLEGVKK